VPCAITITTTITTTIFKGDTVTETHDLIIRGGMVADGEGGPLVRADVAVDGDSITRIGRLDSVAAKQFVDAAGQVVVPGFIDLHNHAHNEVDGGILRIPHADNMLRQGVTTLVAGNCGGSPLPIGKHLDEVAKLSIKQNYAILVGLGTVRSKVMQGKAEVPNAEQRDLIRRQVAEAVDGGALGVSAGYFPQCVQLPEIVAGARGAAERGGIYASHIRSEGDALLEAVAEIIQISEQAEIPVHISHVKTFGKANWHKRDEMLGMIDKAAGRGIPITADRYPYLAAYGGITDFLPGWARAKWKTGLSTEELEKMRKEVQEKFDRMAGPEDVIVAPWWPDPDFGGKSIAQIARERNMHPADATMEVSFRPKTSYVRFAMCEENLKRILAHPLVMIATDGHLRTLEDGYNHPRNYGTFPRVLARYVREQKVISLETAIAKMTSMPARKFRIPRRGILREGYLADIVVFDPQRILDTATFENPHQYPTGISTVILNGGIAVQNGETTTGSYGRVLRKQT
jgi:N-acyl-D-aspartate/D-glutamate deacylase